MRHFFITLYLLGISLFSSAQQEEKAALLITHYGSSDPQTRALTLDVVTREAQEAFPQFTVREAYISPIVRKRLAKEGVYKDSPTDALLKLRAEGYRTIYVQSTTLIEGSEMTSVRRDADKLRPFFKEIKVGNPLLYSVEDCGTAGKERRHCLCGARQPATQHGYLRHARLHDESPWTEELPRQHH